MAVVPKAKKKYKESNFIIETRKNSCLGKFDVGLCYKFYDRIDFSDERREYDEASDALKIQIQSKKVQKPNKEKRDGQSVHQV
jgi:hypothetical protein